MYYAYPTHVRFGRYAVFCKACFTGHYSTGNSMLLRKIRFFSRWKQKKNRIIIRPARPLKEQSTPGCRNTGVELGGGATATTRRRKAEDWLYCRNRTWHRRSHVSSWGGDAAMGRRGRTGDLLYEMHPFLPGSGRYARFAPTIAMRRAGGVVQRRDARR